MDPLVIYAVYSQIGKLQDEANQERLRRHAKPAPKRKGIVASITATWRRATNPRRRPSSTATRTAPTCNRPAGLLPGRLLPRAAPPPGPELPIASARPAPGGGRLGVSGPVSTEPSPRGTRRTPQVDPKRSVAATHQPVHRRVAAMPARHERQLGTRPRPLQRPGDVRRACKAEPAVDQYARDAGQPMGVPEQLVVGEPGRVREVVGHEPGEADHEPLVGPARVGHRYPLRATGSRPPRPPSRVRPGGGPPGPDGC